jgi:hypothetical protein
MMIMMLLLNFVLVWRRYEDLPPVGIGRGGLDAAVLVVVVELGRVHRHQPSRLQPDP